MESLLYYLIRSVLVCGLLSGYYAIALRGRRMHGFNRFYLLSSVVLALVLPLVRIPWNLWPTANHGAVQRVLIGMAPAATGKSGIAFWSLLGLGSSVLASGVMLAISIGKIRGIYRLKRASLCTPMDGYELVETEAPGTPFSFLRNLFWGKGVDRENVVNRKMLAHELAHIRGRHSWDILGMQTVVCIFWMNPFFWYIRRELNLVLEFTADAASGADGDPELLARMLLQAYTGGYHPTLSNAFFHSPIKRRLVMITNNNRPARAWMRKVLVAPVLAAAVLFFACSKDTSVAKVPPPSPQRIVPDGKYPITMGKDTFNIKYLASGNVIKIASMKVDYTKRDSGTVHVMLHDPKIVRDDQIEVKSN